MKNIFTVKHTTQQIDIIDQVEQEDSDANDSPRSMPLNAKTFVIFWLVGLLTVFFAFLFYQSLNFVYLFIAALIISVAMDNIIEFFAKKWMPRGGAIAVTYILFLAFLLSGVMIVVPFILTQMSVLLQTILDTFQSWQSVVLTQGPEYFVQEVLWLPRVAENYLINILQDPSQGAALQLELQQSLGRIVGLGTNYLQNFGSFAVSFVGGFFWFIADTTIVITLAVLFSIEKKGVMRVLASLGGSRHYNYAYAKIDAIYKKLGLWLKGQLLLCIYIGLIVFIALQVLSLVGFNLPSKGSLALIAWLTEFIPYIWPLLGGLPAIIFGLVYFGIDGALVILLVYWFIQWTENNVLIPVVMNKTLGISPILVLSTIIVGGIVMGFLGILLGVPIAVIISMLMAKRFK
jgi:predicted PurR-regulated permease PerM